MKAKKQKGERITSIDEMLKHDLIMFDTGNFRKVYHKGWYMQWTLKFVEKWVNSGMVYAVKEETKGD